MEPLTTWICDTCGGQITDASIATIVWSEDEDHRADQFLIVHKNLPDTGRACDPGPRSVFDSSTDLLNVLGDDGAAYLLSMLSIGPIKGGGYCGVSNMDNFVDLFRRVQTPWYEEARPHFQSEDTMHRLGGANELLPYMPQVLRGIVDRHSIGDPT